MIHLWSFFSCLNLKKKCFTSATKGQKKHLTFYFVLETDLSDEEIHEAYKNLDKKQYLSYSFIVMWFKLLLVLLKFT